MSHKKLSVEYPPLKEGHRRVIDGHVKIIYRIVEEAVYVTDFFDSRSDPGKMKG